MSTPEKLIFNKLVEPDTMKYLIVTSFSIMLFLSASLDLISAEPEVAEIYFDQTFTLGLNSNQQHPEWIKGFEQSGGFFNSSENFWSVASSQDVGVGWFAIHIDPQKLTSDLALALMINDHDETNIAIQLYNELGEVVAVDLFANAAETIRTANTDLLIIPLGDYEEATSIVIRRIAGRLEVAGLVLLPVVSEIQGDPKVDQALIELIGDAPSAKYQRYLRRKLDERDSENVPLTSGVFPHRNDDKNTESIMDLTSKLPFVLLQSEERGPVDVYFMPMDFPPSLAIRLADDLEQELGLNIVVSVQMGTSTEMYLPERNQYNTRRIFAESLVVLYRIKNQTEVPYAVILTSKDINTPPYNLRFNFATHSPARMSIVSTARMDGRNLGSEYNSEIVYSRLKKMVKKSLGIGYFGYNRSLDQSSVMYSPIMSVQDLDKIGIDY
jgi:predicted Zn-dependent protease